MLSLVGFGLVMGILFAAPPGIVTAETLRRGIRRGFPAALSVQLGSLIGDATYCLLALAGVAMLVQNPLTERVLGVISVCFLSYLAVSGIRAELKASRVPQETPVPAAPLVARGAFVTGMLLSLTNPWAIGFWLSLGGALASYGAMESGNSMAVFFFSFFGACLAYALILALLIGVTRRAMPPRLGKILSLACSVVIGMLALGVALQVVRLFLA